MSSTDQTSADQAGDAGRDDEDIRFPASPLEIGRADVRDGNRTKFL